MHLKELNHRSPLRLFERSVHGGVGKGNIGIVASRTGVGKTAFMTCIALDNLLRDLKVLHVTTTQTVDHVREYYEEMFADLAREAHLEETVMALDKIEHNRFIRSLNGREFNVDAFGKALGMLREEVGFKPDVVMVDGYDFVAGLPADLGRLRGLARECECEIWMTMRIAAPEDGGDWHALPPEMEKLGEAVGVCVVLQPDAGNIRIRLVKDHDNADVADLGLDLDPKTFLIRQA